MSTEVMCSTCGGSGIGSSGEVSTSCYDCGGTGGVSLRDEKGRFKKYAVPPLNPNGHLNTGENI